MTKALDGIDAIAWADYRHAHGSAADVPAQLRALASPDADVRSGVWDAGFGLLHQGDVYEATAFAVPFMFAMAADDAIAALARVEILGLLTQMARARGLPAGPRLNPFTRKLDARPESIEADRRRWTHATHEALASGRAIVTRLLGDPSATIRAAAAELSTELTAIDSVSRTS